MIRSGLNKLTAVAVVAQPASVGRGRFAATAARPAGAPSATMPSAVVTAYYRAVVARNHRRAFGYCRFLPAARPVAARDRFLQKGTKSPVIALDHQFSQGYVSL
jgi:hypothetical protein